MRAAIASIRAVGIPSCEPFASVTLGAVFLGLAFNVFRVRDGRAGDKAARQLFGFSIFYLFALFAVILGEQIIQRFIG